MSGYILLEGGAEFGGKMAEPDKRALVLAGGFDAAVVIIPAAAAPDNNHRRAGQNGVNWFRKLGAKQVESLPIIDKSSANDPALAQQLAQARLIYLLGGFTGYLNETLMDSLCWQACVEAYRKGAVIAGSSAGAMVLCEYWYDYSKKQVVNGLGLVMGCCVLPHYNNFRREWTQSLAQLIPQTNLLGIDEVTGILSEAPNRWQVYGGGTVTVQKGEQSMVYSAGNSFSL
ncbi:MAG: Type 1 glutamine amidotransferase-like domain-containing protein [Chloroflexi bacterium]|uniref:Type 1 glutamine amidotransferase-like domain-containing protein n=1 Tax=Candidatus Chlorohelix allophototropha TaxID=3003348 RepID=A0A8T7M5V6_9CHLR|nr:Type 1 glutamine amidotransferase-like domain-containing protein [Chloroflexota bacterium]WJW69338.1 Type 1 glutamine amidotransferase-like domain-containing protein [Chloroflexota bacterium L227-S17]